MQLASTGINLLIFIALIKISITTNVIKVAHLQPNNPNIINEVILVVYSSLIFTKKFFKPQVLAMCHTDMKERAILPPSINFQANYF